MSSSSSRDDAFMLRTRNLLSISRPIQSDFLVAATVVFEDATGIECTTQGVNGESCILTSCICAERAAILAMRLSPTGWRRITDVYITSTAKDEALVTPGLLCREFMCEYSGAAMRVREALSSAWEEVAVDSNIETLSTNSADIRIILFNGARISNTSLFTLYPYRPRFHGVPRVALNAVGRLGATHLVASISTEAFFTAGASIVPPLSLLDAAALMSAYTAALDAARKPTLGDALFPLHLAAAFAAESDEKPTVSRGATCLEYGCSVDAVGSLMSALFTACAAPGKHATPRAILQVDQWGVLAPPSAPARAQLAELGLAEMLVALHDESGILRIVRADALSPLPPDIVFGVDIASRKVCGGSGGEGGKEEVCNACKTPQHACQSCGRTCTHCLQLFCIDCVDNEFTHSNVCGTCTVLRAAVPIFGV